MTKLLNVIIIVLALALVAVILYPQIQENRPRQLRIACDSSVTCLPFLVGVEDSLFVQSKLIPELFFYSDPEQALADLFAGQYDIGVFPWSTVFKRMATHGETLRVFMDEEFRATLPVDAIVIPATSKIKALAELKDKRFGYPPQLRDYVKPLLININVNEEQVTLVEVPFSDLVGKLAAGELDAAWLLEPLICTLDTAQFRVLQSAALPKYVSAPFPGAAVGFAPSMLDESKVMLSRLKMSTDAAIAATELEGDRGKRALGRYFPFCSDVCGLCRVPEVHRLVEINRPAVSALADRLKLAGALENEVQTGNVFVQPAQLTR
jgi:ABC-type nitrate/sulfonate/bicarbonate transport system substrate-binding protein